MVGIVSVLGVTAFLIAASVVALFSYRSAYRSTEQVRVEAAKYMRERAALLGRLAELQSQVARTQRFAAKIEATVNVDGEKGVGVGPVDEENWLPLPQQSVPSVAMLSRGEGTWTSPFSKSFTAGLNLSLEKLSQKSDRVEERIHAVFAREQDRIFFWASLPTAWPTQGWVTSEFGARRHWGGRGSRRHAGIDVAAPTGTPIMAPGDGVVTYTGYKRGYGRTAMVDHGYGLTTVYGHCSSLFVAEGQHVKRGMIIAAVGNTGRSTGPHLHYEVRMDGVPVDPRLYLAGSL